MIILLATVLTHSEKNFFDGAIGKSQFLFLFRIALLLKSYMSMVFFWGFASDLFNSNFKNGSVLCIICNYLESVLSAVGIWNAMSSRFHL